MDIFFLSFFLGFLGFSGFFFFPPPWDPGWTRPNLLLLTNEFTNYLLDIYFILPTIDGTKNKIMIFLIPYLE